MADDQEKEISAFTESEHSLGPSEHTGKSPGDPKKDISFGSGEFPEGEGAPLILNPYLALKRSRRRPSLFDYLRPKVDYSWERPRQVEKDVKESLFWFKVWPMIRAVFSVPDICDMCQSQPAKFRVELTYTSGKIEDRLLCIMCNKSIEIEVRRQKRRERRRARGG